jgi:hypothetical protein
MNGRKGVPVAYLQRNAWWGLVAVAVIVILFGVGDIVGGAAADPGIPLGVVGMTPAQLQAESAVVYRMFDFSMRSGGTTLVVLGILMTAILLFAFRSGQRWAWWTMWALPAWAFSAPVHFLSAGVQPGQAPPPPLVSGVIVGVLAVAILLVSVPRFFSAGRSVA